MSETITQEAVRRLRELADAIEQDTVWIELFNFHEELHFSDREPRQFQLEIYYRPRDVVVVR